MTLRRFVILAALVWMLGSGVELFADPFTFTLIGRSDLPFVSINNNGVVAYSNGGAIIVGDGMSTTTILDTGGWFSHFGLTAINDAGAVAFSASLDNGVTGIFATNGTNLWRAGDQPDINNSGAVPFVVRDTAGNADIYTYNPNAGGTGPRIATTGTGQFGSLTNPSINDAGQVAFVGTSASTGSPDIFIGNGVSTARLTDGQFNSISYSSVNNRGTVAFTGELRGDGTGIFTTGSTGVTTVAQEDGTYHGFGVASLNDLGWVAYMGSLRSGGNGIFLWDGTGTTRVIGTGDALFDSTVVTAYMYPHSLNDSGQIAMLLSTADGDSWVVRADPTPVPEPSTLTLLAVGIVALIGSKRVRRVFVSGAAVSIAIYLVFSFTEVAAQDRASLIVSLPNRSPITTSSMLRCEAIAEAVLEDAASPQVSRSTPSHINGKLQHGQDKFVINVEGETLFFLTQAAFDNGQAVGTGFTVIVNNDNLLIATHSAASMLNSLVINKKQALGVWTKTRGESLFSPAPDVAAMYLHCR